MPGKQQPTRRRAVPAPASVEVSKPHPAAWIAAQGIARQMDGVRLEPQPDGSVRIINHPDQ